VTFEIGKFYWVPCVLVESRWRAFWMPDDGCVPVIGRRHSDAEHLQFNYEHYHVDWRFVAQSQYEWACGARKFPHGRVVTSSVEQMMLSQTVQKRRLCRRHMPDFPSQHLRHYKTLEAAYKTCTLKAGHVCPHRGISLSQFARPDSTAVCPGHGLRWNLRTGALVPREEQSNA
jgi:Rieske [2Fe-2S] domain